jgi:hypothetical protein
VKSKSLPQRFVGEAAAHLVAARLSLLGYTVATTSRNAKGADAVAENPVTGRAVSIQVKSRRSHVKGFILQDFSRSRDWLPVPDDRLYAFVTVGTLETDLAPKFYFVGGSEVNRLRCQQSGAKSWWVMPTKILSERYENLGEVYRALGPPPAHDRFRVPQEEDRRTPTGTSRRKKD